MSQNDIIRDERLDAIWEEVNKTFHEGRLTKGDVIVKRLYGYNSNYDRESNCMSISKTLYKDIESAPQRVRDYIIHESMHQYIYQIEPVFQNRSEDAQKLQHVTPVFCKLAKKISLILGIENNHPPIIDPRDSNEGYVFTPGSLSREGLKNFPFEFHSEFEEYNKEKYTVKN